jgi:hypothetical protein
MSTSIDEYKFVQEIIDSHEDHTEDDDLGESFTWVMANGSEKAAYVVTIDDEMPARLRKRLLKAGYKEDDSVMVVIQ